VQPGWKICVSKEQNWDTRFCQRKYFLCNLSVIFGNLFATNSIFTAIAFELYDVNMPKNYLYGYKLQNFTG